VTGQIGGNAAAYGNVGSVAFLTVTALPGGLGNRIFFQMVVALIVASFVPSSSRNRKARTMRDGPVTAHPSLFKTTRTLILVICAGVIVATSLLIGIYIKEMPCSQLPKPNNSDRH